MTSDAEQAYIRALSVRATPGGVRKLARLYADTDRMEEALKLYPQAIEICREQEYREFLERELSELREKEESPDDEPKD